MKTAKLVLRIAVIVLGIVAVGLGLWRQYMSRKAFEAPEILGEVAPFTFVDQSGNSFGSADLKGRMWVANFLFTRCQGPCPLIAHRTSELHEEFKSPDLNFVSFTVDPENDTPAVLTDYAKTYGNGNRWHLLTGDKKEIYTLIRNSFHLAVEKTEAETGSADDFIHSTYFVLVDSQSRIRGYFNSTDSAQFEKLRSHLRRYSGG